MTKAAASTVMLGVEHDELRTAVRAFFAATAPESVVRREMETAAGYDRALWRRACAELGLAGLGVPERFGGSGFTFLELSVVLDEAGRALFPSPLLSSAVLATTALLASGDDAACADYLPGIAAGDLCATVALPRERDLVAADGVRLTGSLEFVLDGHTADLLLMPAATGDGSRTLFAVEGAASGLTREPLSTMDQTRKLARVEFDGTPARAIGPADAVLDHVERTAAIALACEQVGGAQRVLEMTVAHAKDRAQFGRAIGSFQAVKHRCADMLVDVESARSVATYAAHVMADRGAGLPRVAAMAKAFCSGAYVGAAEASVQLHGGIGFTWEHSAHLHLKRAKSGQLLFGDPIHHRRVLGDLLGL